MYFFEISSFFFDLEFSMKSYLIYVKKPKVRVLQMRNLIYSLLSKHLLHFQRKQGLYSQVHLIIV